MRWSNTIASIVPLLSLVTAYDVVREYSGTTFFDRWDFYGSWDNLTLGDVWWLDRASATQQQLAYVDENGHAILKVDNTSNVPFNEKRNTVRITSQDFYGVGSLWIVDLAHLPWGCSVWPAFWTKGPTWPNNGEIDIIEGINLNDNNQYALHTTGGCSQAAGVAQSGISGQTDCSQPSGCVVQETAPNSYLSGFAAAGGGVWAAQFDVEGIFIWFWSRPNVPASVLQATSTSSIDITGWGVPSASYPASSCNIAEYFTAQQLVFDITLCGAWAGIPELYGPQCGNAGTTGICYNDNVVGPGSPKYDEAYFEVNYLRAYTTGAPAPTPSGDAWVSGSSVINTFSTLPAPTATFNGPSAGVNTSPNASNEGSRSVLGVLIAFLVGATTAVLLIR
ncbi:concanavalin A-like lectin/glucanase domain-containing protein [Amylostereum chailletii]|nr:concanavalin A-like lectin/glucanase domain-containing protein [Amylostereum chailletii]